MAVPRARPPHGAASARSTHLQGQDAQGAGGPASEGTRRGRILGTILRLPDFYGPGVEASYLHSLFQAAAKGGTGNMVGPIDTPHEFVYVPDVGPVLLNLAARPGSLRQVVEPRRAIAEFNRNFYQTWDCSTTTRRGCSTLVGMHKKSWRLSRFIYDWKDFATPARAKSLDLPYAPLSDPFKIDY